MQLVAFESWKGDTKRHRVLLIFLLTLLALLQAHKVSSAQILALHPPAPASPLENVYYVSSSGNDNNPGTLTHPWRTLQKAADTLVAGDTVYIRAGTYRERLIPENSGSSGNYITFAAYPGETVVIDGSGISLPSGVAGLVHISRENYIKIVGLQVKHACPDENSAGIVVSHASHIYIEGNYTYNTVSSGIGVWVSDHVTVLGNEVELACNGGHQESITIARTDTFEVKDNHVHHGGPGTHIGEGIGIDVKNGSTNGKVYGNYVHHQQSVGIYVDSVSKHTYNIEVFDNVVHDAQANFGIAVAAESGGLLENVTIYNNVIYDSYSGIYVSRCCSGSASHPMRDITIINNTIYGNGIEWGGGMSIVNPDIENLVVRNNILSQNLSYQLWLHADVPLDSLVVDYNLIDGFRGGAREILGDHHVEGDPMFRDPAGADFHIQIGSLAIDSGRAENAPDYDFDGDSRPQGEAYDIGADEYAFGLDVVPDVLIFWVEIGEVNPDPKTVRIESRSDDTMTWTATLSPTVSWLSIAPGSGTTPAVLTVTVDVTGLGTLFGGADIVLVGEKGATRDQQRIQVNLAVVEHIYRVYLPLIVRQY